MAAGSVGTLVVPYYGTTPTVYCVGIFDGAGKVYRFGTTNAFETYATANMAEYVLLCTELGTDSQVFQFTFPTDPIDLPAGLYYLVFKIKAGGSYAENDLPVYEGYWIFDGTSLAVASGTTFSYGISPSGAVVML